MNDILLPRGIDAIIPAAPVCTFDERIVHLYLTKDVTDMIGFLVEYHPDLGTG